MSAVPKIPLQARAVCQGRWLLAFGSFLVLSQACSRPEPAASREPPSSAAQTSSTIALGAGMTRTPKEEATDLMNMLVPFAEKMLREEGGFYPYGGAMLPDGTMTMIAAYNGTEHPPSKTLIDMMETSFREAARARKYKATAMVYDVKTIPPGTTEKTDAIAVRLDHQDGYSVVVMIPYRLADGGEVVKGTIFASKGDASIFPAK
jgi:hypothetical protein